MTNINSTNLDSCHSCHYCNYCHSCHSCHSCDSCDSCSSCYSCTSCNYCHYCDSCYSCTSCNYCTSCYSCTSCNYCTSCYYSKNLRMSERMLFCLGEGKYKTKGAGYQKNNCIFNVQVTKDEWDKAQKSLPNIKVNHTYWVDKEDMTKNEKDNHQAHKGTGGYLKRISYEEAWANWWSEAKQSDKQAILDLSHFNAEIFKGITGIDVNTKAREMTVAEIEKELGHPVKVIKEDK